VSDNTISNLEYGPETWWAAAIMLYHYVSPAGVSASAQGNTITDCQIGIIFKNANAWAQGNTVSGGTVGLVGTYAEPNYAGTYTASFMHNTVSGAQDCTFVYGGKTYYYENAAIGANTYATLTPGTGASLTITIQNNQLTGGGSTDADGVMIDGSAGSVTATISNNIISGWDHGINLASACVAGVTITCNNIQNNVGAGSGIHIGPAVTSTNVHANFNNIVGNAGTGVYGISNLGSGTLDAENNWWGDATGPYHSTNPGGQGNPVSDNVDFDPWLGNLQFQPVSYSIVSLASLPATLTVRLTYESPPVGVSGVPVKFSSNPTGLTFTPNPQTTDSDGYATVTATTDTAGVYTVIATVCGILSDTWTLVVYEPVGMTAGGGWYLTYGTDPDIYGTTDGATATFGFVAKYLKDSVTPTGNLEFQYYTSDGINLKSTTIQWLRIGGNVAQFGGTATVNGVSTVDSKQYYFRAKAQDKGEPGTSDEFMIKIWLGDPNLDGTLIHASHSTLYGGNIIVRTK